MTSQPDVDELIQSTHRYEFSDGLRDIQFALLFGFGGLATWLAFQPFWLNVIGSLAQTYGRWAAWFGMLPVLVMPLAVWGMLWVMKVLRKRWLWRESGMVKPSRWLVPRRVNVLSAVILLAALAASLGLRFKGWVGDPFILKTLWVATGWSFGYTLIGVGRSIGLPRYIWLGVTGGLTSTVILFLPLDFSGSSLVFGLIWFVLLTGSGVLALHRAASARVV